MNNQFNLSIYEKTINQLSNKHLTTASINVFDNLDSTNKKLWQLINSGINLPTSVIALQQTSGKGQWGKVWQSKPGGLYISVGIKCDLALTDYFHLIMATAEGVANFLRDYKIPVNIKWCNDLILNNRKLGGIKIETKAVNNTIKYAVIGVGINWNNEVPDIGINLSSYYKQNEEKKDINGSLLNTKFQKIDFLEQLAAITTVGILNSYYNYLKLGIHYTHSKYQQLLNSIDKQIVIDGCKGTVLGVTTQGKLRVRLQSSGAATEVSLSPGEISIGYD